MKTAVILFNLGGPDSPAAVEPFLFNLFSDAAIITVPQPIRWLIAKIISSRRAPIAREIYGQIGGKSPILENTQAQADALEAALGEGYRCFIAMRYWHPRALSQIDGIKAWGADRVILVPLYPQFSTTTTGSSTKEWHAALRKAGVSIPTREICCWPVLDGFVEQVADDIRQARNDLSDAPGGVRVLFSAHGLPKRIVERGDPYQIQVEQSVAAIVAGLGSENLDYSICYQSRVGRLEWIGPSTDAEIRRAGAEGKSVIVVPVAFVSEHSETLVELDIEYRHLAAEAGVPIYHRVLTVGTAPGFIASLADLIRGTAAPQRFCPVGQSGCMLKGDLK